jgi:predicted alpha/beta-hydrolase family hydrolase
MSPTDHVPTRSLQLAAGDARLAGDLTVVPGARGLVLVAHGSGSSRRSPRNVQVARALQQAGFATLLFDLLTAEEERVDVRTREFRFDIPLLSQRLVGATRWIDADASLRALPLGYFGASTGSAAALIAAAELGERVGAVVSRGGRPDLAGSALPAVTAPTQLNVGGEDDVVIRLNEQASSQMRCVRELAIVPGASHLFEEPGTLEAVQRLAAGWFARHLAAPAAA